MMKNKKNKYFLFLAFLIIFLLLDANLVLALEVQYPAIPGLPSLNTSNPNISAYVGYFFGLLVYVAGFLALISFIVGAVSLIASAENPELASSAKDRMKGAVLGLVLTVASFIIIQTINPKLAATITPLPGLNGVFLTDGSGGQQPCPEAVSDTSTLPTGFNTIQYVCSNSSNSNSFGSNGSALLVWMFPKPGLEVGNSSLSGVTTREVQCGGTASISSGGSFKVAFEIPGVYYYLDSGCREYSSDANTGSNDNIAAPFNGKINGIKIVNDSTNKLNFGVIFHKVTGLENGGGCSEIITTEGCSTPTLTDASAADIFKINQDPNSSGDGVAFYSEPYGWDTGANAGFYPGPADTQTITSTVSDSSDVWQASDMNFDYTNVDRTNEYRTKCVTFQNCPGSINIKGDYLVALYSSSSYCQTFTQDIKNLNTEPIVASGSESNSLGNIYIIPTQ